MTEHQPQTWTRIVDPDAAAAQFPAWFGHRMVGLRGHFGLLLATGEVLRITSITALHLSSLGSALLDVHLDRAGSPDGVDQAWQSKHYLGAPVPGATAATVNLAQVTAVVAFVADTAATQPHDAAVPAGDLESLETTGADAAPAGSLEETIERANQVGRD